MKVLIVGATGMVGGLILKNCIEDKDVSLIVSIGRKPSGQTSEKLKEREWWDFDNYDGLEPEFKDVSVAYFCIGVYTGSVPKEMFKKITVDFAQAFADKLKEQSPDVSLSFLSGAGADLEENSKVAFCKCKGMAENYLIKKDFKELYIFRPGYIYPVEKRVEPNLMYSISRSLYPVLKIFAKNSSIKSTELARAMFAIFKNKPEKTILENRDILKLV